MSKQDQIQELENQLAELRLDLVSQQEEIQGYKKSMSSISVMKTEYEDKMKQLQAEHAKEVESLKNLLKSTETSVNRRVTETLASIGVNTFASEEIVSSMTSPKELHMKFLSLKGEAQTEFYRKHEKALSSFINAKQ